ncbi:CDP-alcohol phosphatidyltransferase family protein [Rhodopila sp.]|jgi:cardiolipin synthase|uniref:CDP-alcohol phosphatidyltransferase family protein n=1 Tax=Rhodopila sp. TaxID=2480087 RepID=UPI002BE531BC|nr:CDP-alcohol phosphatidyltransferase family protein [Rhodopila sp.]HVZ09594.1 CDP-alcohol phosphatidyltransferase family protein [Rhodopila sp.]
MPDDGREIAASTGTSLVNPANVVTFARLCAVPLAVWLVVSHQVAWAFWLFVAAGLSDALDGWLARRFGGNTLGAALDPAADKALLVSMYVTLGWVGVLPDWLAILVVFRDVLIVGGIVTLSVLGQTVAIRPLRISKLNTLLQIVLIGVALLESGLGIGLPGLTLLLIWVVALTTLASGAAYVWNVSRGEAGDASGPG